MPDNPVEIIDGLPDKHRQEALRILFAAFADKFRHGFQDADEFARLFAKSVDGDACSVALRDGQLLGVCTMGYAGDHNDSGDGFYRVSARALLTTFWPWKTARIIFNLLLLHDSPPQPPAFHVESIAVTEAARGLGVGTLLMERAESRARDADRTIMRLEVIALNHGAIRLYERLGYRIVRTQRGFWIWLATKQDALHTMEKQLKPAAPTPQN